MAVYIVRAGDTLSSISKRLGIPDWRTLYETNKGIIGANPNLIRTGQQLTYGDSAPTPAPTPDTTGTGGTQAGAAQPIDFNKVLPWEQYFNPELVQGSAEEAFARYYAPIAQQRQEELEGSMANRGLMRSGIREKSLLDLYNQMGQEHQKGIEADILQQKSMAQEDYARMQELYEKSSGKQKPATTAYTPYKVERPKTDAGIYGSSYIDWLNRAIRK